jgi:SEC-C motif-containing protein
MARFCAAGFYRTTDPPGFGQHREMNQKTTPCPCGSPRSYADCCGRWHRGLPAPDAEALMRSRYSAYVLRLDDYLLATWHPASRPARIDTPAVGAPKWLGLEVIRHEAADADHAVVEFVARYKAWGRARRLHETSRFRREQGRWFYVDGDGSER